MGANCRLTPGWCLLKGTGVRGRANSGAWASPAVPRGAREFPAMSVRCQHTNSAQSADNAGQSNKPVQDSVVRAFPTVAIHVYVLSQVSNIII